MKSSQARAQDDGEADRVPEHLSRLRVDRVEVELVLVHLQRGLGRGRVAGGLLGTLPAARERYRTEAAWEHRAQLRLGPPLDPDHFDHEVALTCRHLLREALKKMRRADLIGNGKKHLVPSWQPKGTGDNRRADKRGKDLHHRISVRERAKPGRGRKPSTRR